MEILKRRFKSSAAKMLHLLLIQEYTCQTGMFSYCAGLNNRYPVFFMANTADCTTCKITTTDKSAFNLLAIFPILPRNCWVFIQDEICMIHKAIPECSTCYANIIIFCKITRHWNFHSNGFAENDFLFLFVCPLQFPSWLLTIALQTHLKTNSHTQIVPC